MFCVAEHTPVTPLETSRVVTSVFDQILESVHRGELKPGQRISDAELADEFGVSRTPVREALQRLREIGIIEASASRFTRIAVVNTEQLAAALKVWVALYGAVVDETVPRAEAAWADEMERHHAEFRARMQDPDEELATANFLFYDVLAQRSENAILKRSITGVVHVVRLGSMYLTEHADLETMADAQQHLMAAVRTQDADAARQSLRMLERIQVSAV